MEVSINWLGVWALPQNTYPVDIESHLLQVGQTKILIWGLIMLFGMTWSELIAVIGRQKCNQPHRSAGRVR